MTRVRSRRVRTAVGGPPRSFMESWDLRSGPLHLPADRAPIFATDADRRAAWERHGDWLMDRNDRPGHRPEGWWNYTAGIPARLRCRRWGHPDADRTLFLDRLAWLASTGRLEASERRDIERSAADLPTSA